MKQQHCLVEASAAAAASPVACTPRLGSTLQNYKRFDTMFPFEAEQAAPKRGLWLIPAVPTCTSQLVAAGSAAAVKFTGNASGRLQFKDVT